MVRGKLEEIEREKRERKRSQREKEGRIG